MFGFMYAGLPEDEKLANLEKSLTAIQAYLERLDDWSMERFGQRAHFMTHQTDRQVVSLIMDNGLKGGVAIQSTATLRSIEGVIDSVRKMGYHHIHAGSQGFAHRGANATILILVTGRSIQLTRDQNVSRALYSFLVEESLVGAVLPPKYIMGALIYQEAGSMKLAQNKKFAG